MKKLFSLIFSVIFYLSTPVFAELLPPAYSTSTSPSREYIKSREYISKDTHPSLLRKNKNVVIAVVGTIITIVVGLIASNTNKGKCTPPRGQCGTSP